MSQPVPGPPSPVDAAPVDASSSPLAPPPSPTEFPPRQPPGPHSAIEREIERSERASAALATTRALTRAAFTDSELAADDAREAEDIDTSGWIRTEYAALDPLAGRPPAPAPARNLVGGSFNPGIASQEAVAFPGVSLANTPIRTRNGDHARFLQESRQAPRPGHNSANLAQSAGVPAGSYDKPAVVPMLAPAMAVPPIVGAGARVPAGARQVAAPSEAVRFAAYAAVGAIVVLMGGGVAWKAGLLSHASPANAGIVTPQMAAQAEAARVLSQPAPDLAITPAAGVPGTTRSDDEVNAALAAAARAAAVPTDSVRAAGPARVPPAPVPVPTTTTASLRAPAPALVGATAATPAAPTAARLAVAGKQSVADAIAKAQAKADHFLSAGDGAAGAPLEPDPKPAP